MELVDLCSHNEFFNIFLETFLREKTRQQHFTENSGAQITKHINERCEKWNWVAKATVTFLFELLLSSIPETGTAAADAADLKRTRSHVYLSDTFGIKNRMSVNESAAWLCE